MFIAKNHRERAFATLSSVHITKPWFKPNNGLMVRDYVTTADLPVHLSSLSTSLSTSLSISALFYPCTFSSANSSSLHSPYIHWRFNKNTP